MVIAIWESFRLIYAVLNRVESNSIFQTSDIQISRWVCGRPNLQSTAVWATDIANHWPCGLLEATQGLRRGVVTRKLCVQNLQTLVTSNVAYPFACDRRQLDVVWKLKSGYCTVLWRWETGSVLDWRALMSWSTVIQLISGCLIQSRCCWVTSDPSHSLSCSPWLQWLQALCRSSWENSGSCWKSGVCPLWWSKWQRGAKENLF